MSGFIWSDGLETEIAINGQTLECACFGPPPEKSPTIILLHEGLGCVHLWKSFPIALTSKTGCGVFAYSRSGYGRSSPAELPRPLDYMTREATQILPQLLDHIRLERGLLLGHSDGATIAAIYAGTVVDMRIRGLILMAPHFFGEQISWESIAAAKSAYNQGNLKEKLGFPTQRREDAEIQITTGPRPSPASA